MIVVERSGNVPAAPEEVWRHVEDLDAMSVWFSLGDRFEVLEGSGLGRKQRMHGTWGKKRSEIDQRVVDHDPPHLLGWVHEAERLDGKPAPRFAAETHFTIRLEPSGSGTKVTLRSEQRPAGPVRGLVMKMFGTREVATAFEGSLEALRARLSADPG